MRTALIMLMVIVTLLALTLGILTLLIHQAPVPASAECPPNDPLCSLDSSPAATSSGQLASLRQVPTPIPDDREFGW